MESPALARYDEIGGTYGRYRQPDPRVEAAIRVALGDARSVVNVGTGTGSYEPSEGRVVGLDPSIRMLRQRPREAAPAALGVAEHLPFATAAFDAATALLTVHHWTDYRTGLRELARVSRRQVVLSWDREVWQTYWLADYFPELWEGERDTPTAREIARVLRVDELRTVPVPWDCKDGFCGAYWRRPELYLDPDARQAISGFARAPAALVERVIRALRSDLDDGSFWRRHAALLARESIDLGYRLIVAKGAR